MKISVITPSHDPRWLARCFESLKSQTFLAKGGELEWVVALNGRADPDSPRHYEAPIENLQGFADEYPWIRIVERGYDRETKVGAVKKWAFGLGTGDVLVELDHDDELSPWALEYVADVFADPPLVDFAFSECIDFADGSFKGEPTYHSPEARAAWKADGWRFVEKEGFEPYPICWEPTALSLSTILWAPNHLRAWRRSFYEKIGGHDASLAVCDDLDLLQRTYLAGRMVKIDAPLYRYRVHGENTWIQKQGLIATMSDVMRAKRLHQLVAREMELRGLPCVDLGGAINPAGAPWIPVDVTIAWDQSLPTHPDETERRSWGPDLSKPWPFADHSIGAFRAFDFLEHLADKNHTMSEIYRCLAPGGWLLSMTPAAALPAGLKPEVAAATTCSGAFQDPTHLSYWVENSFRYYTEASLGKYIGNTGPDAERFMACRLHTTVGGIAYVVADLVSLKGDDLQRLPGRRMI